MRRVLLVDGYDDSREVLATELRAAGYDVVAVTEEEEAVLALANARGPGAVDAIVLDLPLAEAIEAARAIRAKHGGRDATILAIVDPTDTRSERDAAHTEGIDYFVLRPCPPSAIVAQLRRLLRT